MSGPGNGGAAVEAALAEAGRKGFRLAVLGRTGALIAVALFYVTVLSYPSNLRAPVFFLAAAMLGLVPLMLVGGRYERAGRYGLFAFDAAAISAVIAFAPISMGDDVPQNLVFLSSRANYYLVVVATSILALSPLLVLWTGACAVAGLAGATAWIASGMERTVGYDDLPGAPTREQFMAVALDADVLNVPIRINEGLVIALVTCIAALAVGVGAHHIAGAAESSACSAATCRCRWPSSFSTKTSSRPSCARRACCSPTSKASPEWRSACRHPS